MTEKKVVNDQLNKENMPKKKRRKKLRLKKSVRRTAGALLLASSLIVAAIPVSDVAADDGDGGDSGFTIPTLEEILSDTDDKYYHVGPTETSVTSYVSDPVADSDFVLGFTPIPVTESTISQISDADNPSFHEYIELNNDRDKFYDGYPVPIYQLGKRTASTANYEVLVKYTGGQGSGYTPAEGTIDLNNQVVYTTQALNPGQTEERAKLQEYDDKKPTPEAPTVTHYIEWCFNLETTLAGKYQLLYIEPYNKTFKYNLIEDKDGEGKVIGTHYEPVLDDDNNHVYEMTPIPNGGKFALPSLFHNYTSVKYIGNEAFSGITNFNTISIPPGVTEIGNKAFYGNTGLQKVNLNREVTFIGTEAFAFCENLNEVSFKDENGNIRDCMLSSIGDAAFANSGITSVEFPHSVQNFGSAMFYGCSELKDTEKSDYDIGLTLGMFRDYKESNHPIIGDFFFAYCKGLTASKLPIGCNQLGKGYEDKVDCFVYDEASKTYVKKTVKAKEKYSGYGIYAGCDNLRYVDLPESFGGTVGSQVRLSPGFFANDKNLQWVRFFTQGATAANSDFVNSNNADYHPGVAQTVSNAFAIWGPQPDNSTQAFQYAIDNTNTYMYYDVEKNALQYILVQGGYRFTFDEYGAIQDCDYTEKAGGILTVPKSIGEKTITVISPNAFQHLNKTDKPVVVNIPDSIVEIGARAFEKCGAVEEINCKTKGVNIGEYAFANNPVLKTFNFDQTDGNGGKTNLGEGTFYNDAALTFIAFRNDDCTTDGPYFDVNIGEIGKDAFYTTGPELTMLGKMERGYGPYEFAIDGENNFFSKVRGAHILYKSGNPQNLSCKYVDADVEKGTPGFVGLVEYPDQDTIVHSEVYTDADGNKTTVNTTVKELWDQYIANPVDGIFQKEYDILMDTQFIVIPEGITRIDGVPVKIGGTTVTRAQSSGKCYKAFSEVPGLKTVTFMDSVSLPDRAFEVSAYNDDFVNRNPEERLSTVTFAKDCINIGSEPFYVAVNEDDNPHLDDTIPMVTNVQFLGENETGSEENPRYYFYNGIIYSDRGNGNINLDQCLTTRGLAGTQTEINVENDTDPDTGFSISDVTSLSDGAFYNCDHIMHIDLSTLSNLKTIPDRSMAECDNLSNVELNKNISSVEDAFVNSYDLITVVMPSEEMDISDEAFKGVSSPTLRSYEGYAAERYVKRMNKKGYNYNFRKLDEKASVTVKFYYFDEDSMPVFIEEQEIPYGWSAKPPNDKVPAKEGYTFNNKWKPDYNSITEDTICYAFYEKNAAPTPVPSSTDTTSKTSTTSTTQKGTTTSPSGGTTSKSTTSATSSSSSSSSSSTSTSVAHPIILSGNNAANPIANPAVSPSGNNGGNNTTVRTSGGQGKTSVISTADGISDVGKMSATVNGSSDNYVVKITQTQEANDNALAALQAAFGDITPIRYLPIDISLYDSTGTNKISPIPAGTSISITMPIPDDLAIYGGNAKVASTVGGTLEKIQPRFTVINSVPCMTFTVTHLSPYVIYVDTANLTEAGIADITPKTADPIHPKWFLCIGLAALSIVLFLKKDPEEYIKKVKQA